MACFKPGELAFIPAPKLLIRRVGAHEAASAVRAAELGDATAELRTKEDFEKTIHLVETDTLTLTLTLTLTPTLTLTLPRSRRPTCSRR